MVDDLNPSKIFSVEGKVIALIGSAGILGTQYVKLLTRAGAKVVVGDIDINRCNQLCDAAKKKGLECLPVQVDNTDESSIINFFSAIREHYGQLDVLVNNAQVKPDGFYAPFEQYAKKTIEQVLDGNLIGMTLACREASRWFLELGRGVIINVSSIYGITAADQRVYDGVENIYFPDEQFSSPVSYAISKAGVVQLTKYLASYFREKNIRVNCLTPGGVFDDHETRFDEQYSWRTTLGRMADRNEYNGAILFLSSDASSYMTGANLVVDGGWSVI